MKTSFASPNQPQLDKIETFSANPAKILFGAAALIVNKILHEMEAAQERQALRRLTRQQLEDIGLSPFDRDRLLS
jgi:uncharacterized protein YjiS (DUF1127 family)